MNKQYTYNQIIKSIRYWKNVLSVLNETKNELLSKLFETFGIDCLCKSNQCNINNLVINKCFDILNTYIFSSKLVKIPIIYSNDTNIRKFLLNRKTDSNSIPKTFFGVYSVICDNDTTLSWKTPLILRDDVILLNKNHIENKSITFLVSCLCHEMIHYYDKLYGEYCDFIKYNIITNIIKNLHNTLTFDNMKNQANNLGLSVIQDIPYEKTTDILDKEAINRLYQQAQNDGLINENLSSKQNIDGVSFFKDRPGFVINLFD